MNLYTPTEIITAGITDTRETFAHLYVELDELRAAAAYNYHLAFVDVDFVGCENGRLPFHPAPAGFDGNELALTARTVRLDRLTDAGLALYAHGVRTALHERDQLLEQIQTARHDLERMLDAIDGTAAATAARLAHQIDIDVQRAKNAAPIRQVAAWDVPVRIPGPPPTPPTRRRHR